MTLAALLALAAGLSGGAAAPRFYADDPVSRITDSQDASKVQERDIDLVYDTLENSFYWPGDRTPDVRAQNLNTVDEVPDSNWFTNRIGTRAITVDELLRGPDTVDGPASGNWTVIAAKNDGVTPGFRVRDAAGQVWFLKFDPPGYRGMATGTEVVVTKLFWALGYFLPEVHLASLRPEQLTIDEARRSRRRAETSDGSRSRTSTHCSARHIAIPTARTASSPARPSTAGRWVASAFTALAPTIRTTRFRTSTAASCAPTARFRPG